MGKGHHRGKKQKSDLENKIQFSRTIAKTGKWRGKKII